MIVEAGHPDQPFEVGQDSDESGRIAFAEGVRAVGVIHTGSFIRNRAEGNP